MKLIRLKTSLLKKWLASKDPFMGFSIIKKDVDRTALTEHELQILFIKKLELERLFLVKDIFLFSCFSGLAYADVQKLKRSEIAVGIDGKKWIFINRQKTNTFITHSATSCCYQYN